VALPRVRRIVALFGLAGLGALLIGGTAHAVTTTTIPTASTPTPLPASIGGTLAVGGNPVPGVRITVSKGSAEVGKAVSDARGGWRIRVPGPGTYQVALDVSSLPSGVHAEHSELSDYRVFGSFPQSAGFNLTSGTAKSSGGQSRFDLLLNLFVSGIRFGLIVGLCSVGLSLIYGTTGLVNFAHGELVTFGALIAWLLNTMTSGPKLPLVLAAVIGMIATGLLGAVLEVGLWRPLVRRRSGAVVNRAVSVSRARFPVAKYLEPGRTRRCGSRLSLVHAPSRGHNSSSTGIQRCSHGLRSHPWSRPVPLASNRGASRTSCRVTRTLASSARRCHQFGSSTSRAGCSAVMRVNVADDRPPAEVLGRISSVNTQNESCHIGGTAAGGTGRPSSSTGRGSRTSSSYDSSTRHSR
jgi:hypothetical protein